MAKPDIPGFLRGSNGKEPAHNAEDPGSIPGLGRAPGEEHGNPLQVFLPGEFHGQGSLVGCSPWGRKDSDTTERLTTQACYQWIQRDLVSPVKISMGSSL